MRRIGRSCCGDGDYADDGTTTSVFVDVVVVVVAAE